MPPKISPFLQVLDPTDTDTGGGTASALAGAMAAALVGKVARLSAPLADLGPEAFFLGLAAQAEALAADLLQGGMEDSAAFKSLRATYRLPRQTEEEKSNRARAIQQAVLHAATVPLANAGRCRRVWELCAALTGRSNTNAASDLECAGHLARAGLLGCLANVEINLPLLKNELEVMRLTGRVRELRDVAESAE
jgi:methenyltetrahydrofolate cyclohydrolase